MKKIILGILLALAIPMQAMALTATAEWTYDKLAEPGIEGFRFKDQNNLVVADKILPTARTAVFTIVSDGKTCLPFYMVTYKGTEESSQSNIYTWCPVRKPLIGVGTFTIKAE